MNIPATSPIAFPGLLGDWRFTASNKALAIGHGVYWYGVLIALGALLGLRFCLRQARRFDLNADDVTDTALWCIPAGIVGARLYYVVFHYDLYRAPSGAPDLLRMLRVWDGGLAVYGGLMAGFLAGYAVSRVKRFPFLAMADNLVMGVLIGQTVGRWGNFMNREAFGATTDVPWRMRLWTAAGEAYDVHPTFLYESLWNLAGFLLLWLVVTKRRRFSGENLLCYLLWYALGRFWIEGLRADSLYLFGLTLFGAPVRVSQALSALLIAVSAASLIFCLRRRAHSGQ